ncbi:Oidioi.mRNA.OKI2018_I69.XSR.g13879.t1.cds [Oikopleura dioica]|uniref:Oidioi.mRNA.OKI2018_I69.XSR.g13879.t1.cds n=1 Tax=Oikopleura dioica TaxID=34765 RepID=A0ABN7SBZ7_OIKDI|nr:Oidioi.mRNA.OKI2018_I69.XSR.g13879.t1.cds [Oikopleura dioica]
MRINREIDVHEAYMIQAVQKQACSLRNSAVSIFEELNFRMKFPETARSMWTLYGGYHREFMPGFRQNIIHEIKKTTLHQHRAAPIGCIHGPISPFRSQIVRDDQGKVYKIGDQATFIIVPRDANGQEKFIFQKKVPEKQPFVVKIYPEVHKITVYPCLNAAKKLFVKVDVDLLEEGEFNVQVILNWYGIISKPFPITVDGFDRSLISFIDEDREQEVKNQPDIVSGHGHGDDQVNRAWGVCALPGGLFAVGDRGNHQVKVFTTRGEIVDIYPPRMTPGEPMPPSTERGLFDKPCGLAYTRTPESAIVVADKDNHRVAILLWDKKRNKLNRAFGKEGTKIGQFKYPWDVSVNLSGEIAVSDSRNWRVQLFTFLGDYIASFGYGNEPEHLKASVFTSSRPLNYPRGIVFDKKGNLLVTDFNAHTVTIIDPEFKKSMQFGCSQKAANGAPSPPSLSPPSFSPPHRDDLDWSTLDISDNDSSSEEEQQQTSSAFMHYFDLNKDEEIDHVIMERPAGIAIDRDGNFYVAVCKFRKIYVFNPDRTLRGKIINENLRKPAGICITTEGRLVVVEEGENDRISTVEDQHRILIF